MSQVTLALQEASPHYAFGVWGDFMILDWRQAISESSLVAFEAFSERAITKVQPQRRSMVVMVNDQSCTPNPKMRQAMAQGLKRYADRTRSSALIYETPGVKATVVRSIATAMSLIARESAPIRVFGSVRAAVEWQTSFHQQPQVLDALLDAVTQVRVAQ